MKKILSYLEEFFEIIIFSEEIIFQKETEVKINLFFKGLAYS